jgi:alcohol dehydrogenase class IV
MMLSQPADWMYPIPTLYGPGRVSEIGALCLRHGMRAPLVVTDRGSRTLPFMQQIADSLAQAGLSFGVFSDVSPNPRDDEIAAGARQYRDGGHDGVLGVGGGSGMDGAKAVCLVALNDIDLLAFDILKPPPEVDGPTPFPPLITVPTTAGTGAETEATPMITETARMMKWCLAHPRLRVAATILDPEITVGLPAAMTAWTGCDALVHAIEAYAVPAFYPLCDGAALEALRLIATHLDRAVAVPDDIEARGGMLVGSYLAGIAFLKGLGFVHAISHMVGAEYDTHHGLTNAVVLPAVLRYNAPAIADKIPPMAEAMGLAERDADSFYGAVCGLLDRLDIPASLSDLGVDVDNAPALARKAMEDGAFATNPRTATVEEMQALIETAVTTGR